jgi:hypothetical protein
MTIHGLKPARIHHHYPDPCLSLPQGIQTQEQQNQPAISSATVISQR